MVDEGGRASVLEDIAVDLDMLSERRDYCTKKTVLAAEEYLCLVESARSCVGFLDRNLH